MERLGMGSVQVSDDWEDVPSYSLPAPKPGALDMRAILAEANKASKAGVPDTEIDHWINIHTGRAAPDSLSPEWEDFSPGPGKPTQPDPHRQYVEERQREQLLPAGEFVGGMGRGLVNTGIGIGQLASRASPFVAAMDYANGGRISGAMDDMARDAAATSESASGPGKVGEFVGGMVATAPIGVLSVPAKGAPLLSALARAGAGGAAAAATQPVAGDFWSQKGTQTATGAALGASVPAVGRGAMAAVERVWGPNALAQLANVPQRSANAAPYAQEGEDLAARTGVRMTPGQVSGSKVQTAMENMSRQSLFSADRAFAADKKVAEDTVRYIDRVMDNVTRNPGSEASIGTQIQAVTRSSVEKIAAQREKIAAQEYGAIDAALNGRRFVTPDNATREADAIIREFSAIPTPEAERIVRQAQALKDRMASQKGYTFKEAQQARGYYGKGARGGANVFDDVNPDINRRIATRLFKAFDADMEQSALRLGGGNGQPGLIPANGMTGAGGAQLAAAIKQANANYRRYSQLIEATKSHPIARLFGDNINIDDVVQFDKIAPETVIKRLTAMHPSELQMVRGYMENNAPEAWQQYKRLLIERALDSARTLPTSAGKNTVPFNAALFMRALGGDKPDKIKQLNAIFSASELSEIDDAFNVARRLGDRFGYNGSNTGPYNEVQGFLKSIKERSVQALASSVGEAAGLHKIATVMLNADGRRALNQLSKLPPQSRQAASLAGYLSALLSGQQVPYPSVDEGAKRPNPERP